MPPDPISGSQEDDLGFLDDMLSYARDAMSFMVGKTREDLSDDRMLQYAVIRAIEVIGEASRRVSKETVSRWNTVPWPVIYGMRNRLAHDYHGVDGDVLFRVVTDHLPILVSQIEEVQAVLRGEIDQGDPDR